MSISSDKLLAACICIVLAASTIAVFWQVREFDFVNYDDNYYVYENPGVTGGLSWKSFIAAFTTPHVGNWLPGTNSPSTIRLRIAEATAVLGVPCPFRVR